MQLPFTIRSEAREQQAEKRRQKLEDQLLDSTLGLGYVDATEKITQLNRPVENNLMGQITYLTAEVYNQIGLTENIFNGTASEQEILNYYTRSIGPVLNAIVEEMRRKFITKTGRSQGQSIMWFNDPFQFVPVGQIADIADKFTRNAIITSNEMRAKIGMKPSKDPIADELSNKNINQAAEEKKKIYLRKEIIMTKKKIKYDFGGYATKANVKCSDGRTIMHDAFVDQDGAEVPIVWQHMHNSPGNILGKGKLENRDDGVYVYGKFNDTQNGRDAAKLVAHGDISSLSIYANSLIEKSKKVAHGVIREVSLVVAGANPGAKIDNLLIEHSNSETGEEEWVSNLEEAIIHMDLQLESEDVMHSEDVDPDDDDDDDEDGKTIEEVFESMTDEQKEVTYAIAAKAAEAAGGGDDDDDENDDEAKHNDEGGNAMHTNVFDESTQTVKKVTLPSLTHEQRTELFHDAMEMKSLKAAVIAQDRKSVV